MVNCGRALKAFNNTTKSFNIHYISTSENTTSHKNFCTRSPVGRHLQKKREVIFSVLLRSESSKCMIAYLSCKVQLKYYFPLFSEMLMAKCSFRKNNSGSYVLANPKNASKH